MGQTELFGEPPLSTREAAAVIGVTPKTVCEWVKKGIARPVTKISKSWVFTRAEVERLKRENEIYAHKHNRPRVVPERVA